MKTFLMLTVAGLVGVVLFKLVLLPLLALFLGLLGMAVKLALIAAVVFFLYSLIRKQKEANVA